MSFQKYENALDYITKEKDNFKKQLAMALPKHLTADRMLRVVMTELRLKPKLLKCSLPSVLSSIITSAQLGLEVGILGHSYLVPYGSECQLIIGYKGMLQLAYRSGQISSITVNDVYSADEFRFNYGLHEELYHKPFQGERGEFIGAYVIVKLKDGSHTWGFMYKKDIDKIRERSKVKNDGPWVTDYAEMAKKTVIRRVFKLLPISAELQKAIAIDEASDNESMKPIFLDDANIIDGITQAQEENVHNSKSDKLANELSKHEDFTAEMK